MCTQIREITDRASWTDDMVLYVPPNFIFLWPCEVSIFNPCFIDEETSDSEKVKLPISTRERTEAQSSYLLSTFSPRDCCTRSFHVGLSFPAPHFYQTLPGVELFPRLASVIFRLWSAYAGPRMFIWEAFAVDKKPRGNQDDTLPSQLHCSGSLGSDRLLPLVTGYPHWFWPRSRSWLLWFSLALIHWIEILSREDLGVCFVQGERGIPESPLDHRGLC